MAYLSREQSLAHARDELRKAGHNGAEIRETTPQFGGLRKKWVDVLVAAGEAEWIILGERARLCS